MSSVELHEGDFGSFFDVPAAVYGEASLAVPPFRSMLRALLDARRNPTFAAGDLKFLVAKRGDRLAGRIVCHVHRAANAQLSACDASFGFFDCLDDEEVARVLLGEAEAFAREHGCKRVRGSMNLTAMQESGVVIAGFDRRPYVGQIYNPPHIPKLLEAAGYAKSHTMTTHWLPDLQRFDTEGWLRPVHRELLADAAYRFRPVRLLGFDAEVEGARELLNRAMSGQPMFVPMTKDEMRFQMQGLRFICDPRIIWIAEHLGKRVGMVLALPNLNPLLARSRGRLTPRAIFDVLRLRRRHTEATIVLIAIDPLHQARGVIGGTLYHFLRAAKAAGYQSIAGTWISDDNSASIRQTELLGFEPYHRTAWYSRDLD